MIYENIQLALEGLRANKMRALLTMLGIIIGVGSVIAIMMVGDALQTDISASMQTLGATNIVVYPMSREDESGQSAISTGGSMDDSDLFTDEMVEAYREKYHDKVEELSLSVSAGTGVARNEKRTANISELGVNASYAPVNHIKLLEGKFIGDRDVEERRPVVVISDKAASNLFPAGKSAIGGIIKLDVAGTLQEYAVLGVYEYERSDFAAASQSSDKDIITDLYVPITTCRAALSMGETYTMFTVMAWSNVDIDAFTDETREFFNTVYYKNNAKFRVEAMSMKSVSDQMEQSIAMMSMAVTVIAAISLLVGGIGVMNIMLVSVTERTREIGTRKAIGARGSAIRAQFIIEAIFICLIGGMLGCGFGLLLGYFGGLAMNTKTSPSVSAIVISVSFSVFIGVFFGFYPANKASKMNPIEALRYE